MPDTILYNIAAAQDCNCYEVNGVETGGCPSTIDCTCGLPPNNNNSFFVTSIAPEYITDFDVDQITPLSTVYDDGVIFLQFDTGPGNIFNTNGVCNIEKTVNADSIVFVARLPEETDIIDFNSLVYVYCGIDFGLLNLAGPCVISENVTITDNQIGTITEISIQGLVGTYSDTTTYNPSMRYVIGVMNATRDCLGLVYVDKPLNFSIDIDTFNPNYNKADCDGVNDLSITSTIYNQGLGYAPINLPDGFILQAGSKFIIEIDDFVFNPYNWNTVQDTLGNDSFRLGYRGYVEFTGGAPGPGATFSFVYLNNVANRDRLEITILEDWEVGDLFDISIENGNPTSCPGGIGSQVHITYDFTNTGVPFRDNGNMISNKIEQILTIT